MKLFFGVFIIIAAAVPAVFGQEQASQNNSESENAGWEGAIQSMPLESKHPYFLPTHPRVTLTVRFPDQITDIDGAGFTANEAEVAGEYRISWREGDDFLSITPLPKAQMRNLNVIIAGQTIVLVVYPVDSPFKSITALNFTAKTQATSAGDLERAREAKKRRVVVNGTSQVRTGIEPQIDSDTPKTEKRLDPPTSPFEKVGAARLIGMIDRMKVIHATKMGEMDSLLSAMPSVSVAEFGSQFDQGVIRLQLVRVVRDSRLDLVGFIVLVRNLSKGEVVLDPESWAARVGLAFFPQSTSDCQPKIAAGGSAVAYFVVAGDGAGRPGYMKADNEWRISVDLLSPRINPGATLSEQFAKEIH